MRHNRINLLYVHSSSQLWGSDRCLYHMLKLVDRQRYQPCVILPCKGPLSEKIEALGIDIVYPPCMSILYRFRNPMKCFFYFVKLFIEIIWLTVFFKRRRVALVHVNTSSIIGPLIAARLCRVSVICHIREIRVSPRIIGRILVTTINILADHVIAISRAVADYANTGWIKPLSLEIIHDGLDSPEYTGQKTDDRNSVLSPPSSVCCLPPGCKVVSVIGRVTFLKGIHVLIDAAKEVLIYFPNTYFLIVGASDTKQSAKYEKKLQDDVYKSKIRNRVIFTGFVNDIDLILSKTDILVLPSVYPEGFGMAVIEAMLAGVPVIATSHGGPRDIIEDGREGFLIKPDDHKQLAEKIAVLIKDPSLCKQMGRRAHLHVARDFQMRKTMDSIHRTYTKIVGNPSVSL